MAQDELSEEIFSLEFAVAKSIRYHMRRLSFITVWERTFKILLLFSGSGAFFSLIASNTEWALYASVIVATVSAFENTINLSESARKHNMLYKDYYNLLIRMNKEEKNQNNYIGWREKRLEIEREQPPELDALNIDCHNAECESRNFLSDIRVIRWWQKPLINIVTFQKEFPKKTITNENPEKIGVSCAQ